MIIYSCDGNEDSEMTTISGVIHSPDSKKVYLSKIDHFDYMNNGYIIDSSDISEDGKFKFSAHDLSSNLISITTADFRPFTLQILNNWPETYFAGNCEKFYTNNPTFYIEKDKNIDFEWFQNFNIDSIGYLNNSKSVSRQIRLRDFYLSAKKIDSSDLDFDLPIKIQENWKQLLIERGYDIRAANLKQISSIYSFDNYLYTEIYLGSLNYFLNWIERFYPEEVKFAIQNPEKETVYSRIFSEYKNHNWNPRSFEYYKFTERYVSHYMNIESKDFEHYYIPSENKREIAKQVLDGENKKRYVLLMKEQLENAL